MRWICVSLLAFLLAYSAATAADVLGDGVEEGVEARPLPTQKASPAVKAPVAAPVTEREPAPSPEPRREKTAAPAAAPRNLKPIEETRTQPVKPVAMPGPDVEYDGQPPSPVPAQAVNLDDLTADRADPAAPVDLIADRPGTPPAKAAGPFAVDLEEFSPEGVYSAAAKKAYAAVAGLKKQAEQLSADLDAGGKERTRLIYCAEAAGKDITDLAKLWPNDQDFRDVCLSARRTTLVLEEELRNEPRKWTHVRWAFSATLTEIKKLRRKAVDLADAEPKPTILKTKEGKEIIVEAPKDPDFLKKEEESAFRKQVEGQKETLRRQQEDSKKQKSPYASTSE